MSPPSSSAPSAASGLRLARAVVFAAVCGAVSAGGHALAGGGPVPLPVYGAAVLAALGLAYLIDGRERGPVAVLAATAGTQLLLHQLFDRLAPAPAPEFAHAHPGPGMALVHLTVAALTAWWLHRGERALWLVIRLYATPPPAIGLLVVAPVEVALPSWPPATPVLPAYAGETVSGTVSRRGPPREHQRPR
ncbi:MFS transporter [Nonomuraea sp. KC401]|uniref:MFS transporter n=1 Tax=unclassified Nonomuraea TaxID=2593643 RepID=UPI0010FF49B1|nr:MULTISPECIES: MFS transporter [unclassified Nonomuraea]NBE94747.1 MFS transporter [Nonomuraea sp. K271]TLF64983.1 MFS transporter [Nonomuraea sp. KC401]